MSAFVQDGDGGWAEIIGITWEGAGHDRRMCYLARFRDGSECLVSPAGIVLREVTG